MVLQQISMTSCKTESIEKFNKFILWLLAKPVCQEQRDHWRGFAPAGTFGPVKGIYAELSGFTTNLYDFLQNRINREIQQIYFMTSCKQFNKSLLLLLRKQTIEKFNKFILWKQTIEKSSKYILSLLAKTNNREIQ